MAPAGERLIQEAHRSLGSGARDLVIDPPVDASTGQPAQGAVQMAAQLAGLITHRPRHDDGRDALDRRVELRTVDCS